MKYMERIALIVMLFLLAGCGEPSPEELAKNHARDTIKVCWQSYDKKSLEPAAKRFVAGVCEKLEDDYRDKYHHDP